MKHRIAVLASLAPLLLATRLAAAAPTTADGWYEEGQTQYTLGNFDKAVEAFKSGFALETVDSKKPAYLYNIAQAYRQAGDCKNSVFFYKRFLALKANDTVKPLKPEIKAEVDGWIKDGEQCVKQQDALKAKTPDSTVKPGDDARKPADPTTKPADPTTKPADPTTKPVTTKPADPITKPADTAAKPADGKVATGGEDDGNEDDGDTHVTARAHGGPHKLVVRLVGGGTKVSAGNLSFPLEGSGALLVGYPIPVNPKLTIEAGAGLTFTPAPFDNMQSGSSETAKMFGLVADGAVRYAVAPKVDVRGEVGLGVLVFSGLDNPGNPFTQGSVGTTGALSMFHARIAASVDYQLTPNLAATLTPVAFGYSPAKAGLRSDISAITSIDFLVGLGYRM